MCVQTIFYCYFYNWEICSSQICCYLSSVLLITHICYYVDLYEPRVLYWGLPDATLSVRA